MLSWNQMASTACRSIVVKTEQMELRLSVEIDEQVLQGCFCSLNGGYDPRSLSEKRMSKVADSNFCVRNKLRELKKMPFFFFYLFVAAGAFWALTFFLKKYKKKKKKKKRVRNKGEKELTSKTC